MMSEIKSGDGLCIFDDKAMYGRVLAIPGDESWTDPKTNISIRRDNTTLIRMDMQVFYLGEPSRRVYGRLIGMTLVTEPVPAEVVGTFDTILLHPTMYEAVKKSMMETPRKDALRRDRKRALTGMRDLRGFDPMKPFKLAYDEYVAKNKH